MGTLLEQGQWRALQIASRRRRGVMRRQSTRFIAWAFRGRWLTRTRAGHRKHSGFDKAPKVRYTVIKYSSERSKNQPGVFRLDCAPQTEHGRVGVGRLPLIGYGRGYTVGHRGAKMHDFRDHEGVPRKLFVRPSMAEHRRAWRRPDRVSQTGIRKPLIPGEGLKRKSVGG